MISASPSVLKGPKLTLVVNTTPLSQLNAPRPGPPRQTPFSTTAEYGEHQKPTLSAISAPEGGERVFRVLSSQESTPHPGFEDEPLTPVAETPVVQRHDRPIFDKMLLNEKINKFLNTITHASGDEGLAYDNRNPRQRAKHAEREEHHLIKSLKENQAAQRQQFEEELREKKEPLESRIRELERQLAEKDNRISELTAQVPPPPAPVPTAMTDADVTTWYETRSSSWLAWVDEFVHPNPDRMSELHPLQQQEVLEGVRGFVRLTDDGRLPAPLASVIRRNSSSLNVTRLLLRGMLTDFLVTETLESPFWVFSALSKQAVDLESPMMQGSQVSDSFMSPMAFRLDLANVNSTGMPPPMPSPFTIPPAPTTARSISMLSPRRAPPVYTPLSSLSISIKGPSVQYCLPSRPDMQDLEKLLARTQQKDGDASSWRAQLMRTLADGGLSRDPCHFSMADNEDKQMLANARREYARELKERFLGSAARFFLRDQDAQGIARLEGRLASELDLALRFSAQAWSRVAPLQFVRLKNLGGRAGTPRRFEADDPIVEVCDAQRQQAGTGQQQVVMVVQPALGPAKKAGEAGKVWTRAQVVAAPVPVVKSLKMTIEPMLPLGGSLPSTHAVQAFMAAKNAARPAQPTVTTPITAELRVSVSPSRMANVRQD